jgi:hypothetical protein
MIFYVVTAYHDVIGYLRNVGILPHRYSLPQHRKPRLSFLYVAVFPKHLKFSAFSKDLLVF